MCSIELPALLIRNKWLDHYLLILFTKWKTPYGRIVLLVHNQARLTLAHDIAMKGMLFHSYHFEIALREKKTTKRINCTTSPQERREGGRNSVDRKATKGSE